jgi:EAL domain-containing protein (putative c-di-GMP-specific phosphodiesterase class I)
VTLDDFGRGYSSLERLRQMRFNRIKIDRLFLQNIHRDSYNRAIVEATLLLARAINTTIVAEGIEDGATARLMIELGCDSLQGFYFSGPIPPGEIGQFLHTYQSTQYSDGQPLFK